MAKTSLSKGYFWRGLLAIVLGLVLVIWPGLAANYAIMIIGIMLGVVGIILTTMYFTSAVRSSSFPWGILYILVGILLIAMPGMFTSALVIILGLLLIVGAIDQFAMLVRANKLGFRAGIVNYIGPALILIVGILICVYSQTVFRTIIIVFGASAIAFGLIDILNQARIRR